MADVREMAAVKTVATVDEVGQALSRAWKRAFGSPPPHRAAITTLISQWALETGRGKSMYCYNLGNVKSRSGDGYSYCFFACNEVFLPATAAKHVKAARPRTDGKSGPDAVLTSTYKDKNGATWSVVWFYPSNPACRFRAFDSLDDGADDYLKLLMSRFHTAWPYVLQGNPEAFVRALKQQGYFTADLETYLRSILSLFREFSQLTFPLDDPMSDPPSVDIPPVEVPVSEDRPQPSDELSDQERQRILARVQSMLSSSINEEIDFHFRGRSVDEEPGQS